MKIDLSGPIKVKLDKAITEARKLESENDFKSAAITYMNVSKLMYEYSKYALTRADEIRRRKKAKAYHEHALSLRSEQQVAKKTISSSPKKEKAEVKESESQFQSQYDNEIASLIHKSKVTWEKIGGLEEVKREIKFTYGLALAEKPEGVKLSGWKRILFYGPPGTGKTLLAAATSNGLGATFFNVKVSNILSKYFGESSRIITSLFDAARSEADEGFAVIFIDEIESITLSRESGSDSGAERRVLSTILSELDGLADKGEDRFVLTIAATNTPWDLDNAILSRFQKRIYIPLPDENARRSILNILIKENGHSLDYPIEKLVKRTELYSGRDLERLANQAINIMVEDLNGEIPRIIDKGKGRVINYQIKVRPLKKEDFDRAFEKIRVDVEKYKKEETKYREFSSRN